MNTKTRPHTYLIPSVLESQKSSKRARRRGGVAPSCQPRNSSSACTDKFGNCSLGGGASPMISASDLEKLLVSAMTRHLPAAASNPDRLQIAMSCAQQRR